MAEEQKTATPKKGNTHFTRFAVAAKVPSPQPGKVSGVNVIGWGKDNLYPNQLINLYEESPLHGGLINGKVHYTVAGGLEYRGSDKEKWAKANRNWESDFTLEDMLPELSRDRELFNGFAMKGKWRLGGEGVILEHVNLDELRKGDPKEGEPLMWYYCEDWSDQKKAKNAKPYPEFDPTNRSGEFMFVWMAKSKRPKEKMNGRKLVNSPYPFPLYNSGLRAIMTDVEIAKFDLAEIQNGFSAGTHIHFANGIPDAEDRAEMEREFELNQAGSEAAGGISLSFSDGESKKPITIQSLMGNDQPERYNNKITVVADRILQAHSATSGLLFGIKTPGQLGGTDELETAYDIMKANYFAQAKKELVDAIQYLMAKIYGITGEFELRDVPLGELAGVEGEEGQEVAEVSLNGAQITGLIAILEQVSLGLLNKDSGKSMIRAAFPSIPVNVIDDILAGTIVGAAVPKNSNGGTSGNRFNSDDPTESTILRAFADCGIDRNECEVIESTVITDSTTIEQMESELLKRHNFAPELSAQAMQVLKMIREGESFDSIKSALDIQSSTLGVIYADLFDQGLVDQETGEITDEGRNATDDEPLNIEVRYSYEKRPDVSGPAILPNGRTRDFCATLIRDNRLYTREEIDRISMQVDRSVWMFKGGWYHDPATDQNLPYCRHTWVQNVVTRRR